MEGTDHSRNDMVSTSDGEPSVLSNVTNPNPTANLSKKRKRKNGAIVTAIKVRSLSVSTQTEDEPMSTGHFINPNPKPKPPLWELDKTVDPATCYKNEKLDLDIPCSSQDIPIMELMVDHFEISGYKVGDYVLRMHPSTLGDEGHLSKQSAFWQGPYFVQEVL